MLEFAENLDECRKIQFAKYVPLVKPRIGGAVLTVIVKKELTTCP